MVELFQILVEKILSFVTDTNLPYDLIRCPANLNNFLHETSVAKLLHHLGFVLVPEMTGNNSES